MIWLPDAFTYKQYSYMGNFCFCWLQYDEIRVVSGKQK